MLEIGLTGGIGSGKSTVAALLVERGAVLLDADAIVRELQEPGTSVFTAMVHPAVGDEMTRRRQGLADTDATVVLDIPLLVESGHEGLGGVIVVDVDPEVAVERLVAHRGFVEQDARDRISRQASREDRLARADVVVDNSGTLDDLVAEVDRAWAWVQTLDRPALDGKVTRIGSRAERDSGADAG